MASNDLEAHDGQVSCSSEVGAHGPATPLPKAQIAILFCAKLVEPIAATVIYPFLNQLVLDLKITDDQRAVGYYCGVVESVFFLTEAAVVAQWGHLSDRVGRKPVIMLGLFGVGLSITSFGLSKTFIGLVVSRALSGVLNGNVGVLKCVIAELADETNIARVFSFLPIVWSAGSTIGPLLGGSLSRPADHFPTIFVAPFWRENPYFLPCAVAAAFALLSFILVLLKFEETLQKNKLLKAPSDLIDPLASFTSEIPTLSIAPPWRSFLTKPVLGAIINYCVLSFLDISYFVLLPLFLSTPIQFGGLGLLPHQIGMILGFQGLANGFFQVVFFARLYDRWGPKSLFLYGISTFSLMFSSFPIMNALARAHNQVSWAVWMMLVSQMCFTFLSSASSGCVSIFVAASAPNRQALGSINGLSQTAVSITRAVGPASVTSLFALSMRSGWPVGHLLVYAILVGAALIGTAIGRLLPDKIRLAGPVSLDLDES